MILLIIVLVLSVLLAIGFDNDNPPRNMDEESEYYHSRKW